MIKSTHKFLIVFHRGRIKILKYQQIILFISLFLMKDINFDRLDYDYTLTDFMFLFRTHPTLVKYFAKKYSSRLINEII